MSLRMIWLAAGGAAGAEIAEQMLAAKIQAAVELQTRFMTDTVGMHRLQILKLS